MINNIPLRQSLAENNKSRLPSALMAANTTASYLQHIDKSIYPYSLIGNTATWDRHQIDPADRATKKHISNIVFFSPEAMSTDPLIFHQPLSYISSRASHLLTIEGFSDIYFSPHLICNGYITGRVPFAHINEYRFDEQFTFNHRIIISYRGKPQLHLIEEAVDRLAAIESFETTHHHSMDSFSATLSFLTLQAMLVFGNLMSAVKVVYLKPSEAITPISSEQILLACRQNESKQTKADNMKALEYLDLSNQKHEKPGK